jgi:hypothetical protein
MATPETTAMGDREPSAREVFAAWEWLRLVYNLILLAVVFGWICCNGLHLGVASALPVLAVGANLCFCAGPVAEGYLRLLEIDRRWARWAVFVAGTFAAAVMAVGQMDSLASPLRD